MLTDQWFVKMDGLAAAAPRSPPCAGTDGEIALRARAVGTTYNQWLDNIQDWCISRQLWWGHQIPAWYAEDGNPMSGARRERGPREGEGRRQVGYAAGLRDPTCSTPGSLGAVSRSRRSGWPDEPQVGKARPFYLPSSVLVTGFDIIFFWVARMIMTTLHFTGERCPSATSTSTPSCATPRARRCRSRRATPSTRST
jgi:valyl-tRNA synthetase